MLSTSTKIMTTAFSLKICLLLWLVSQSYSWLSSRPVVMRFKRDYRMCNEVGFPVNQVQRSEIPTRYDSCKMLITGVVGTDPREVYMKNGHYVVTFALAVVGHFRAVHEMEAYKPTETMWLSTEVWDSVAKAAYPSIKKGAVVRGVGFLIHNSWIDKNSGEERKMFKVRMTKMLNLDEFSDINLAFEGTEDARQSTFGSASSDSGFSSESPDMQDQTSGGQGSSSKRKQQPVVEHFRNEVNTLKQEEDDTEQEMATPWWG